MRTGAATRSRPAMLDRGTGRRRLGNRRAVSFLYFTLIGLPAAFFMAGLAVDFTRLYVATQQVANAASAAAVAGAFQQVYGTDTVNPAQAVPVAQDTWNHAVAAGETHLVQSGSATVTITTETDAVHVDVKYRVSGMVFSGLMGSGKHQDLEVYRSAYVCVPGQFAPTGGFCARPKG